MRRIVANALGFQLVWFAAVAGAARGWWWAGPLALAAFSAWQLPASTAPRADAMLMIGAAALGFGLDSLWIGFGMMRFTAPLPWPGLAPVWIVALWMGFALTLNHSLAGFQQRPWLAAGFGMVGGPLAYGFAQRTWHAVEFTRPDWLVLPVLALAWGFVTPLLLAAARRLTRGARPVEGVA